MTALLENFPHSIITQKQIVNSSGSHSIQFIRPIPEVNNMQYQAPLKYPSLPQSSLHSKYKYENFHENFQNASKYRLDFF